VGAVIKDVLSYWLMPLPLAVTLLALGIVFLWGRHPRRGRALVTLGLLLIVLASLGRVTNALVVPLEDEYPKWQGPIPGLTYVVIMGAAHADNPRIPLTNRPNPAALYRLVEGIALYRAHPGSKLIVSGGGGQPETKAEIMARVAHVLGVPRRDLILQVASGDTAEEVALLRDIVGDARFAVVTTAVHMPRTMALFARLGMHPVPVPTHFLEINAPGWFDPPNADNLVASGFAVHEYLGLAWLRIKTWFGRGTPAFDR
jgi:uncharacterized SAM-binding protein YcdF (DUF218 family)